MPFLRTKTLVLDANGQGVLHDGGEVFFFDSSLSTVAIDVTWLDSGQQEQGKVEGVLLGRLLRAGGAFSGVKITGGDPNDTLKIYIGPADAYARESVTNAVIGNVTVINEVEVKNDAGNPLNVKPSAEQAGVGVGAAADAAATGNGSEIAVLKRLRDQGGQAATVTEETALALVAVDDTGPQLIAADATRTELRIKNTGANPFVLMTGAGDANSFANGAVILQPTELWVERAAPGAAWHARCAAGLASSAAIQSVKP